MSQEEYDMVTGFHNDWMVEDHDDEHKNTKDNPLMDFQDIEGEWDWRDATINTNRRYRSAVNSSKYYIRRAFRRLR